MVSQGSKRECLFRVLSFNIRGGGHAPYYLGARRPEDGPSIDKLGRDVLAQSVDIAGLQEVFHVAGVNCSRWRLDEIFRHHSMTTSWGRATSLATPIAVGNMNIVNTSVFEIVEHRQFVLANKRTTLMTLGLNRLFDYRQRSAQYSLLRLRGDGFATSPEPIYINFFNVHLDFTTIRHTEVELLLEHIGRLRGVADHTILVGDFNDEPDGQVINRVLQCGFLDSMSGSDSLTLRRTDNDLTPRSDKSGRRIDYIFFTPDNHRGHSSTMDMHIPACVVLDKPVTVDECGARAQRQRYLSDHCGVLAELKLTMAESDRWRNGVKLT